MRERKDFAKWRDRDDDDDVDENTNKNIVVVGGGGGVGGSVVLFADVARFKKSPPREDDASRRSGCDGILETNGERRRRI